MGPMLWHLRIVTLMVILQALGTARGAPLYMAIRNNALSVDGSGVIRQFVPNNWKPLSSPNYGIHLKMVFGSEEEC